jgi:hypothetical protein
MKHRETIKNHNGQSRKNMKKPDLFRFSGFSPTELLATSQMEKAKVTVSWLLAPFIFNPYQFRPSCWINDIKV